MSGINKVNSIGADRSFRAISAERSNRDNNHAYIASRINDLYYQALSHQQKISFGARALRNFIDSPNEGKKFHKIV